MSSDSRSLRLYVTRSAAVALVGLLLNQTAAQAGAALLARRIPDASLYGTLSLLLQILNTATLTLGLGLNSALVYDVATGRPDPGRSFVAARNGTLLLSALPVALCLLAAPWVAAAYHQPALALALRLGAVALLAQAGLNTAGSAQAGLRRFGLQTGLMVAATALAAAGRLAAVPAVLRGASLGVVALSGTAGIALVAVAGLTLAGRALPRAAGRRDWVAEIPRMLRYGWPLWAGNLLKAFQQPYLVLVAGAVGAAAAGAFANDVALIGWAFVVTWAFRMVAVPLIAAGVNRQERRARATLCFRLNHLALFPVVCALCLWPHAIVTAVYGARYASAARVLPLLALGVYGSSVGRLVTDTLAGSNETAASLPIMLISSLPLLLAAPLALAHGTLWLGALYCLGWAASALYAYLLLPRLGLALHFRQAFLEPLLPTAAAAPLCILAGRTGGVLLPVAAAAVFAALTFAVYRSDGWRPATALPGPTGTALPPA